LAEPVKEFESRFHYAKETFAGKALAESFKNFQQNPSNIQPHLGMYLKLFAPPFWDAIGAIWKSRLELKEFQLLSAVLVGSAKAYNQ